MFFLKTQDLKSLPISNGNSIFASKKGKIFGPISNVNFRLECNSLSCWKNFSYVDWSLNTLKMSSTYLKINGNSIFASKKGKIFGPISNVNFRLECNSLSCWKNFSYVDWSLNTQKMSSTYRDQSTYEKFFQQLNELHSRIHI